MYNNINDRVVYKIQMRTLYAILQNNVSKISCFAHKNVHNSHKCTLIYFRYFFFIGS